MKMAYAHSHLCLYTYIALATPLLLLPFRPTSNPSAARTFIRSYFRNAATGGPLLRGDGLMQELRLVDPMVCDRRLSFVSFPT